MGDDEPIRYVRKICLVGDPAVGKTSLVRRFVLDKYDDAYISTLGAKVMKKDVNILHDGKDYLMSLMLWDVMGQKHFRIIESVAFQHVSAGIIVCDLTRKSTLDNLNYWIEALISISGKIPLIILANKSDLHNDAEFDEGMLRDISSELESLYTMTSAKTGENVEAAFSMIAELCLKGVQNDRENG